MPTADEFEAAAITFDRAADEAASLLAGTRSRFGPHVLQGGRLSMLTDVTIDTAADMASQIAVDARAQADTCRARAAMCRAYAAELAEHYRDRRAWERAADAAAAAPDGVHVDVPRRPRRPTPDHPWIEC